jgi:iron complex outermembrane receptor protein
MNINSIAPAGSKVLVPFAITLLTGIAFGQSEGPSIGVSDTAKTANSKNVFDMSLEELGNITVSPFNVDIRSDKGYRASNSVSGSRFNAPIRDLPFALQAFTEAFIQDQKPRDIFDIARYSPGVTYRSNDGTEGNANLAIRGFAVSGTPGNVQILRDGFHGPSIFDFNDVSRVEVVKGPASFLYGQVAPGGIVNIITKSPQSKFAAFSDARYGSYGEYRFDVDVTGPASNTLFYRLTAAYDHDINYWRPYDAHSMDIAPSLLWQPNKRVSVSLKYVKFRKIESPQIQQKPGYNRQVGVVPTADDPNLSGVNVPGLPDTWSTASDVDFRHSDADGLNAWIDLKADEHWSLRAGYSHQKYTVDMLFSGNGGMANNTTLLQGRRFRRQIYDNWDDSYEVQGIGKYQFGGTSLRLLLGTHNTGRRFDNWAAQAPNDSTLGSNPTASPLPLWNLADPSTWNRTVNIPLSALTANPTDNTVGYVDKSIWGGSTLGFFQDRLLVLAGLRWTLAENQLTNHLTNQTQPTISANAATPQYGVLYKLTPGQSLFASYAESFVPGSQILTNIDGSTSRAKPTKGEGYDIGLKEDLLDRRLSGTLTFFEVRNKNIVNDLSYLDPGSGAQRFYNVQSGEQRSRGVELDLTTVLADNWQLYLSYSYMKARIIEFSGNDNAILAQNPATLDAADQANYKIVYLLHNAPLQMSAPHLANFWTRYDFTQSILEHAYIAGGINFVYDQTLLPDSPAWSRQTYSLVNAMAGYSWAWKKFDLSMDVSGKNLADEHYRPSQSTRSRPREVLFTVAARL